MTFDGTDDFITISSAYSNISNTNIMTFATWAKIASYDTFGTILFSTNTTTNIFNQIVSDTQVWAQAQQINVASTNFDDNQWHHFVFVSDGSATKFYFDGVLLGSGAAGTNFAAGAKNFRLGNYALGNTWDLNGQMDDARFYNYALTATQVKALMNEGAVRYGPVTGAP